MPVCVADVGEQVEDLGLDRDVERRDRLVEDDHARLGGERAGDRDALALAARERARERADLALVEPDELGQLAHALRAALGACRARCSRSTSSSAGVDRLARVEARVRILEDDLHLAAAAAGARCADRAGSERSRPQAVIVPAVGAVQADEHPGDRRLARAGLADDRQRAALRHARTSTSSTATWSPNTLRSPLDLEDRPQAWLSHGSPPRSSRPRSSRGAHAAHQRRRRAARAAAAPRGSASCASGQRGRERAARPAPRTPTRAARDRRQPRARWPRCRAARRRAPPCTGGAGRSCSVADGCCLDDLAGVHHRRAVADGAGELEVVRDEQQREAALAAQLVEDRHDLGLRRHVERRRRLVGEHAGAARRAAPWRSSRAAAGRPTARAGTAAGAARRPRCRPRRSSAVARRRRPRAPPTPCMVRSASVMKSPIVRTGFTCARGSWKMIAISLAVARAARAPRQREHVAAVEADRARSSAPRPAAAAPIGARRHRLARARLADQPDRLARRRWSATRRAAPSAARPRRAAGR